jgi:hypothetical protein
MNTRLLSEEMKATADAIRNVRANLCQLIAEGVLPDDLFPDVTTVNVCGLDVALALERLAGDGGVRMPSYLDERR